MNDILLNIWEWVREDFKSNRIRFCLEVCAWIISVGCAFVMAITVPNPPLKYLYIPWVASTATYAGCAYTRRSFGMLANYLLLFIIDFTALARWWL
jgi:hypothetical protein